MSNELHAFDKYLRSEVEGLELSPSDNVWPAIEQKLAKNAAQNKEGTIRKLRFSLLLLAPAFCLFIVYHYYNDSTTAARVGAQAHVAPANLINTETVAAKPAGLIAQTPANTTVHASEKTSAKPVPVNNLPATSQSPASETSTAVDEPATKPVTSVNVKTAKTAAPDKITVLKYILPREEEKPAKANPEENIAASQADNGSAHNADNSEKAIFIPNAFTPNGDGLNDIFIPKASEEPREYRLSIFDRNGSLIFFTDNFKTGWDGKVNRNGAETIKEDVYMWRIEMKNDRGEKEHLMGSLTLLK
jgi:gliding motility-associated-like protein